MSKSFYEIMYDRLRAENQSLKREVEALKKRLHGTPQVPMTHLKYYSYEGNIDEIKRIASIIAEYTVSKHESIIVVSNPITMHFIEHQMGYKVQAMAKENWGTLPDRPRYKIYL